MQKTNKQKLEEFIRVDHAGERGAIKIYEGQLLALNTVIKDETYDKFQNELRNDMLNVYRQLQDNTVFTRDSNTTLLEQIRQNTDLICKQKESLLEEFNLLNSNIGNNLITRLNAMQLRIEKQDREFKDLNGKLNILAGQYKVHAERLNKMEKLK